MVNIVAQFVEKKNRVDNMSKCPECGKELTTWYCVAGGSTYTGCSDIKCNYKKGK